MKKTPLLLIAEDDADDQLLIMEAMLENGISKANINFVNDGQALIQKLKSLDHLPELIMLDLNMPVKDGRETLKEIKSSATFKQIPVIIFSTSSSKEDVKFTYLNGANTFFTKPALFNELVDVVGVIKTYWFEKAKLTSLIQENA